MNARAEACQTGLLPKCCTGEQRVMSELLVIKVLTPRRAEDGGASRSCLSPILMKYRNEDVVQFWLRKAAQPVGRAGV